MHPLMIFLLRRRIVAEYEKTIAQMIGEFRVRAASRTAAGSCHISTHILNQQPLLLDLCHYFLLHTFICKLS